MRISEVATDRRNINIRRSFKIEGKLSFYDSRFRYTCHNGKDNKKLWIMFKIDVKITNDTENVKKNLISYLEVGKRD